MFRFPTEAGGRDSFSEAEVTKGHTLRSLASRLILLQHWRLDFQASLASRGHLLLHSHRVWGLQCECVSEGGSTYGSQRSPLGVVLKCYHVFLSFEIGSQSPSSLSCWPLGPRIYLHLPSAGEYKRAPPGLTFYVGSRDGIQVIMLAEQAPYRLSISLAHDALSSSHGSPLFCLAF